MPLIDTLSPSLRAVLKLPVDGPGDLVVALAADLNREGQFGEEWLIVTRDRVRLLAGAEFRCDLALTDLRGARVDSLVGGGALIVTVGNQTVELVRFTYARQRDFGRAAKYLADVAQYNEDRTAGKTATEPKPAVETDEPKRCPQCHLLLPPDTTVCPACLNKGKVLWRILGYLKPYWKQTAAVSALMAATTLLSLVSPYLTRPLMDKVLAPRDGLYTAQQRLWWLGWIVFGMLGSQLLGQVLGIIRGRLVVWLSSHLGHDLRTKLYEHLQLLSLRFFDKRQTGSLIARVTRDTESLEAVLSDGAQFFVVNILTLIGIGVVLFVMNWRLTLLILVPAPIVGLLSRWFWRRVFNSWHRYWHARQQLNASLNDSLSGIRVVRAFAQEPREVARFNKHSDSLFRTGLVAQQTMTTFFPILAFLISSGSLIAWYIGGRSVINGTNQMTLGTLTAFIAYLGMFYGPLQFLSRLTDYLARSLTSAQRVFEVLDSQPEVPEAKEAVAISRIEGRVEFQNVTFGYDVHKPALNQINLTVSPGEMIGLVGHSGAGKSTTINLICRFYDVQEGRILIDGHDIKSLHQHALRSQIGVVLQDTFLFNGTVAENISYAKPGATREEIMAAAKTANAHDFIVSKPDGYDTRVAERGQALSAGERQRVAIARAVLHNPRILILDEATSSVDTDTERQIQEAIARLTKGRTVFAIAHRLSTLRHADRLIVLKGGKIEEIGTHDELMEKKGEFFRLVEIQQEMSRIHAIAK
jgi:ATP-binding cassette subfamily B protein